MTRCLTLAALAYLVPTFILGFVWHLKLFTASYEALAMYRHDMIIPLGFASMLIQSVIFAWVYDNALARIATAGRRTLAYALLGGVLSWSFTTLAVGAKNIMSSVPDYLLIETAFTAAQWAIVAPVTTLVMARGLRAAPAANTVAR